MPSDKRPVDQVLAVLLGADAPASDDPEGWLAAGLRLGLERPAEARRLLDMVTASATAAGLASATHDAASGETGDAGARAEVAAAEVAAAEDVDAGTNVDAGEDVEADAPADPVPVRSRLLARSAVMNMEQQEEAGPDTVFGWASMLRKGEIAAIGQAALDQVAAGASADLTRGFGIAWNGGMKLPLAEFNALFSDFIELQWTVCSTLAGHDLRQMSEPNKGGILQSLIPRSDPAQREAERVLERAGKPTQTGLIAIWNTWVAMRYRSTVPADLFGQLTHAWTSVVGPLPDR